MKRITIGLTLLLTCVGLAHGATADWTGDSYVSFTSGDMPLMAIGDTGNAADGTGHGAVSYDYSIGKFEVTAGQYTQFLNSVAAADPYTLYDLSMFHRPLTGQTRTDGCQIDRAGSSGSYVYSVAAEYADRPVNQISWADAARFTNWLSNGMGAAANPTEAYALTEDGSYALNGATTQAGLNIDRNAGATYVLPSQDEWYKAAYYNAGATSYYNYGTGTDTDPSNVLVAGVDPGNNANFFGNDGANWVYTMTGTTTTPGAAGVPWTTVVGEFENSASAYGLFDMAGNVQEMTDTTDGDYKRVVRDGAFNLDYSNLLHMSSAWNSSQFHISESFAKGFRIVNLGGESLLGDFDGDGDVDADDVDILCANMAGVLDPYDLNNDGTVDEDDMIFHVENYLEWDNGVDSGAGTFRGDFNTDGSVNGTDLSIMSSNFGGAVGFGGGNANCDSIVNGTDLSILAGNFGNVATAAVPEPMTMSLLALSGLAVLRRKRVGQ